jgi:hypothetical protein
MRRRLTSSLPLWIASIVLAAPAAWPYVLHYVHSVDAFATGFIQSDMASYMAHAREYFDGGSLTFGNPSSPSYDTPRIYFQPMTLFLGVIWRVTGMDPGLIFVTVGAFAAIACTRVAIALYQRVVGLRDTAERLGLVTFVWGGGVLVLAAFAFNTLTGDSSQSLLRFDPGWWFLSLGPNLVYPTEALYHALFLGCILAILRQRPGVALILAFAVSISHPFTGAQLLLILAAWCFLEWCFLESDAVPRSFLVGCSALLVLHVGYYLVFLSQFPEHRALMEQWAQAWVYHAQNFVPAYLLVGGFAVWRMRRLEMARAVLASPANRLFLVWFAVSFVLANHEFAMRPVQPLHFTRGYVWMPLFLLGAPLLVQLLRRLWSSRRRVSGRVLAVLLLGAFVTDNAVWFASLSRPLGMYQTADQRELLDWLDEDERRGAVLLAEDGYIGYLATVYSPLRAWHSHLFNTPWGQERRREARAFFREGVFLEEWRGMHLLIVYSDVDSVSPGRGIPEGIPASPGFGNATFTVLEIRPAAPR